MLQIKNIKTIAMLILSIVVLASCSDNPTNPTKSNSDFTYNGRSYSLDDVIKGFNNGNLNGVIRLIKDKRNDIILVEHAGKIREENFDGYVTSAYATMYNADYTPLDVENIFLNGTKLSQYQAGSYAVMDTQKVLEINFGKFYNNFSIPAIGSFPNVNDSVVMPNEINITGIKKLDTVSKSKDLDLNWIGGVTDDIVEISMDKNDTFFEPTQNNEYIGFRMFIDNTGRFVYKSNMLKSALQVNGLYDIKITSYHPVYKTIANGRQILCLGISSHKVTVNVTD